MKRAIVAALAVIVMAGSAAAADEASGRTHCTFTAREVWPAWARVLTLGLYTGPETARTERTTTAKPGDAAEQIGREAEQELKRQMTTNPGRYVGVIECNDGEVLAQVKVQN